MWVIHNVFDTSLFSYLLGFFHKTHLNFYCCPLLRFLNLLPEKLRPNLNFKASVHLFQLHVRCFQSPSALEFRVREKELFKLASTEKWKSNHHNVTSVEFPALQGPFFLVNWRVVKREVVWKSAVALSQFASATPPTRTNCNRDRQD